MGRYTSSPLGLYIGSKEEEGTDKIGNYDRGSIISASQSSLFTGDTTKFGHSFFRSDKSYDDNISTSAIIEYTKSIPSMKLNYSDFAYLKKLGVYPNNRLVIARRFLSPVNDDLSSISADAAASEVVPMATLISWVDDNKEFFKVSYGEEWDKVEEASFKGVLNEIGNDVMGGDNRGGSLGDAAGRAFNAIPLQGWTEGLQYRIFKSLGMTDLSPFEHPYGNPNLIRTAMRRKTLGKGASDSGLKAKIEVEMEVEYEQKFINGVDPTSVYYDIIANALTFGTSESRFQFKGEKVGKFSRFLDDIGSGNPDTVKLALTTFVTAIQNSIKDIANKIKDFATNEKIKKQTAADAQNKKEETDNTPIEVNTDLENKTIEGMKRIITQATFDVISGLVGKYKVKIMGIVNALTGTPSTPWHVTIGNPKRPIFSSGDMVVTDVTITMGKLLAFNDLPSSIKINFTLSNARPLGAQEIYKKLNCGKERTYRRIRKPYIESDIAWKSEDEKKKAQKEAQKIIDINNTSIEGDLTIGNARKAAENGIFANHPGILALVGKSGFSVRTEDDQKLPVPFKKNFLINSKNGPVNTEIRFRADGTFVALKDPRTSDDVIASGNYITNEKGQTILNFYKDFAKPIKINSNGTVG
jgi:hypothetical protein